MNSFRTLQELLLTRATEDEHQRWLLSPKNPVKNDALEHAFSHGEVLRSASQWASSLRARNVGDGRTVLLIHDNDAAFVFGFFGALIAGLVPVPFSPPAFFAHLDEYAQRLAAVCEECEPRFILCSEQMAEALAGFHAGDAEILPPNQLAHAQVYRAEPRAAGDIAFIQYTSGSTAKPKGIALSHANILHNVHGIGVACRVTEQDIVASWLPLFHDMGLIGALLFSLYWKLPLVLMSPRQFQSRPQIWLWAIHRFHATLSPAPNFAYHLCAQKLDDVSLEGLSLSSWRVAINGAEPVLPETLHRFEQRFAAHGFRKEAMRPVYGMAENALACTFPDDGLPPLIDLVDRRALERDQRAIPATNQDAARKITCVGKPLADQEIAIIDASGKRCEERQIGEVHVRGPCIMKGIHHHPEETAKRLTEDGWLKTGDLGYLADQQLYVTGRCKDVIKKGGASLDAGDIEEIAASVHGVRKGCVAALGIENETSGTEDLVLLVETRLTEPDILRAPLIERVYAALGTKPDDILFFEPGRLPKTTSGKLRRTACKDLYKRTALQ